jgi:hypothetical protein
MGRAAHVVWPARTLEKDAVYPNQYVSTSCPAHPAPFCLAKKDA